MDIFIDKYNPILNKFPTEIANKILVYIGELNNDLIIIQYHPVSNTECYKINMFSEKLWNIKSLMITRLIYPLDSDTNITAYNNRLLYKYAKTHYTKSILDNPRFLLEYLLD